MKRFAEFIKEGLLDDILADFEPVSQAEIDKVMKKSDAVLAKYAKPKSPYKSYKPRKYKGQKQEGFAQYVRSQGELKKACGGKVTLENIIKIFAMDNIKVADNFQPMIDITELWKIREYDRKMIDGYTGKNTEAEMKKLTADIKKKESKNTDMCPSTEERTVTLKFFWERVIIDLELQRQSASSRCP
jgi:hypothetical protein